MKEFINSAIIIIISALAGAAVSILISIMGSSSIFPGIYQGAAAGALISIAARLAFSVIYFRFRKNPLPAYTAMAGTVGAGTFIGCLLMDVALIPTGLAAIVLSLLISLIMTSIIFNYSKKLNKKLKEKQGTFTASD